VLFFDSEPLPESPSADEAELTAALGSEALCVMDETLTRTAGARWLKVARVVVEALEESGYSYDDERYVHLHVRRVIGLVEAGVLQSQGDLRRPRWSEVRLATPEQRVD
jgi:hypothetical protein